MRHGLNEWLLKHLFVLPYRCEDCGNRFFRFRLFVRLRRARIIEILSDARRRLAEMHAGRVKPLALALDYREQSLHEHAKRVANLAVGVARELGIGGSALAEIECGALLHDIGILTIPDRILLKQSKLSREEWVVVKRHPLYGYKLLSSIEPLKATAEIVYAHHEKFDGSGYPRGLRADEIPLGARLFAIIDAVDAMTQNRPYRNPISFEAAATEVRRCAGIHFDPALVGPTLGYIAHGFGESANQRMPVSPAQYSPRDDSSAWSESNSASRRGLVNATQRPSDKER